MVICGYGEVGQEIVNQLGMAYDSSQYTDEAAINDNMMNLPQVVAFDTKPSLINTILMPLSNVVVMYGNGENPEVLRSHGVYNPQAIFLSYEHHEQVMAAIFWLRASFIDAKIYTRAQSRREAEELKRAGATEVVVEMDEPPRSSPQLLRSEQCQLNGDDDDISIPIQKLLNVTETITRHPLNPINYMSNIRQSSSLINTSSVDSRPFRNIRKHKAILCHFSRFLSHPLS